MQAIPAAMRAENAAADADAALDSFSNHLPPLVTSLPASNIHTPASASPVASAAETASSLPSPASAAAELLPPLVDYCCVFSHELHPFQHTCVLDFLSPTPVLKGHMDHVVPAPSSSSSVPLPDCLEYFVYPTGVALLPSPPPPLCHAFVLTLMTGERLYGYCYSVWHAVTAAVLSVVRMQTAERMMRDARLVQRGDQLPSALYAPQSLCLLTRHNFTSAYTQLLSGVIRDGRIGRDTAEAFYSCLQLVRPELLPSSRAASSAASARHSRSVSSGAESSAADALTVSSPPLNGQQPSISSPVATSLSPAALAIRAELLSLLPGLPFSLPCPSLSSPPFIDPPSLSLLFLHLSPASIVSLLSLLLTESSVLLLSSSLHILTPIADAVTALLFPLRWPYIFIPLLPLSLSDFFQAPQPFIIGAHPSILPLLPSDTALAVVDLDCDRIDFRNLPPTQAQQLPYALAWRLYHCIGTVFPGYALLHQEEPMRPPAGLPSCAVPVVVLQEEEERERREKGKGGAAATAGVAAGGRRRRKDPCRLDSVDAKHRKALMTLRTCRLLHSGTEGEEEEDSRQRGWRSSALQQDGETDDDDAAVLDAASALDLSAERDSQRDFTQAADVSPPLDPTLGDESRTPPPLLPVAFPPRPSSPLAADDTSLLQSFPHTGSRGRSHAASPAFHRSSSSPPVPLVLPRSRPRPPTPPPPESRHLPASFTMSSAQRDESLPPMTPMSAYPALTASRSFATPKSRDRDKARKKSQDGKKPQPPSATPAPPAAAAAASLTQPPPLPLATPSSPPYATSPSLGPASSASTVGLTAESWSALYNADGILTLSSSRARRLRRGFLSVFVSLLRRYRQCLRPNAHAASLHFPFPSTSSFGFFLPFNYSATPPASAAGSAELTEVFDSALFLSLSQPGYAAFLRSFLDSQSMKYFLQDRLTSAAVSAAAVEPLQASPPASRAAVPVSHRSSTLSPLSSSSPSSPFTPSSPASPRSQSSSSSSSAPAAAASALPPRDYFDAALSASVRYHSSRHKALLSLPLSSVLYKLGHQLPVWRERCFEMGSGGMSIRYFSVSEKMLEVERRYRQLRDDWRRRRRTGRRGGRNGQRQQAAEGAEQEDLVLKASLDRVGEQREAMRAQLLKGSIKLEPAHTSVSVPDEPRRAHLTPWVFELCVRDRRWLLCAIDSAARDAWIAGIKARVGRFLPVRGEGHSHLNYAESGLQASLRLLREEQMRLFAAHIQSKVEKLINGPPASASALPLFPSAHTRRSLSSSSPPAASPVSSALPAPSAASLTRALLCAEMMLRQLDLRERVWRLRTYQQCFLGHEAVSWMCRLGMTPDVRSALEVGGLLIAYRVITHVAGQPAFRNDDSLYQFILHAQHSSSGSATAAPASLVTTPAHAAAASVSSAASASSSSSSASASHLPSLSSPTAEDALILSSLSSSLHIRTHTTGLFSTPHPDTFRAVDALDWLVDSGVMRDEADALRWCNRMLRLGEIEGVKGGGGGGGAGGGGGGGGVGFVGGLALYRFRSRARTVDGKQAGRRAAGSGVMVVQEEKEEREEDEDEMPAEEADGRSAVVQS